MTKPQQKKIEQLRKILRGKPKKEIAEKYNCSVEHVNNVINGHRKNDLILLFAYKLAKKIKKEKEETEKKIKKIKI